MKLIIIYSVAGYPPSTYVKDKMYKIAFEGAKISFLVNMIAECYVDVSKKHITHRIASMQV